MGDDLVDRPAELLVEKIKQYSTQHPLKLWTDVRKWLLDDGDIARKRIDELGPDIFFALKDQLKGSSAQAEAPELTPPRSPKFLNSQQRQSGDDEWSDSGCQDVTDAGPCIVNQVSNFPHLNLHCVLLGQFANLSSIRTDVATSLRN